VPDRNGFIVGDDFLPDNNFNPLLVFVNSRSGPQQGHLLITQLRGLLNPIQVWDLASGGPEEILESFSVFSRLRILVCGGDGTVSWIVSKIEKMKLQRWPPIAILPLGTGNDLARIHGWGGGYNNESLLKILKQVAEGYISWLDRWEMTIENKKGKVKHVKSFFNYLGVGADAQAALQVHMLRESRPQLFFSRLVNKAWYGVFGAEDIIKATSVNLPYDITLIADGFEVPLPADSQGIILLNIDSYAGGVPLWSLGHYKAAESEPSTARNCNSVRPMKRSKSLDALRGRKKAESSPAAVAGTMNHTFSISQKSGISNSLPRMDSVEDIASLTLTEEEKYARVIACDLPSSCQDGLLDIVSIRGAFHLGQIRVGLSTAQKLCQCREATIIIRRTVSVQVDGEPWRQNVCTLRVRRKKDPAIMLHRSADESNGVETEMAKLLDWAEDRHLIDTKVHGALMKEFSRRIESKTRQRRVRSKDNLMFTLQRAMNARSRSGHNIHSTPVASGNPAGIIF
jgi:diacylglycerol kinase (ATP)